MTKAELTQKLVALGFAEELLEGKTNAQLQAMLAEAQTDETDESEEVAEETVETPVEVTEAQTEEVEVVTVNTNSKAVMVRNVNHDGKEYRVGQVLTDSDPVRLFLRQGYAQ